jgi:uncharacterized protein involved in outer membrane biogenesis
MKKFLRIGAILFGVALMFLVGLALFVNFYLTDERVKSLLLPRLEETLGRQVVMADLEVGLLRGITFKDFAVKEQDGAADFFRAREFVLRYELLPLFRGRLIVSRAVLSEPFIRIERNRQGQFNFETLAFLEKAPEQEPAKGEELVVLPLALTIDQIAIEKARFMVADQLGEIPAVDGTGNVNISVDTAAGALVYHGRYDFTADVAYQELKPQVVGRGEFNPRTVSYQVDTIVDGQSVHLEGAADNWRESPRVRLDLSSQHLDVDRLLALMGGGARAATPAAASPRKPATKPAPPTTEKMAAARKEPPAAQPAEPLAASFPPGLTATGTINIAQARFQKLEMRELTAAYELEDGILRMDNFSARTAGGKIVGSSRLDLTRPEPSYAATMKMYSLQAGELAALLSERYGAWLTGNLNGSVELVGRGTAWPRIRETLNLSSTYTVRDGQLREFPVTAAVAELLNLPELRAPAFQNLTGNLRAEGGQVLLDSVFTGQDLRAEATGTIGLDGQLNLPVALRLTGELARKIQARTSLARYLTDAEDGVALAFKLTGEVSRPRPVLDVGAAGERLQEEVEKKARQELERFLQRKAPQPQEQQEGEPPPVQDFLKGLFGR